MRTILIGCVVVWIAGCTPSAPDEFSHQGISLTCPPGWEIASQNLVDQPTDTTGSMVSFVFRGNTEDLVELTWVSDTVDLRWWLGTFRQELSKRIAEREGLKPEFAEDYKDVFHRQMSWAFTYEVSGESARLGGSVHCFLEAGKTFAVLHQSKDGDRFARRKALKVLEKALVIQSPDAISTSDAKESGTSVAN